MEKFTSLDKLARFASGFLAYIKEIFASKEEVKTLESKILDEALDGKVFKYLTQEEFNNLTEDEQNNTKIVYVITDAEDCATVSDLEALDSKVDTIELQVQEVYANKVEKVEFEALELRVDEVEAQVTALETTTEKNLTDLGLRVDEVEAQVTALETNVEADLEALESKILNDVLDGRSFKYVTQAEYDALTEEEKLDNSIVYSITDTVEEDYATKEEFNDLMDYASPILGEGVLALNLVGPDGQIYQLSLNSNFDLVLGASVPNRQVNYMMSGDSYYCMEEELDGTMSLVLVDTVEEGAKTGILRVSDGMKRYDIVVEDGVIGFNETNEVIDNEAKYIICSNNPDKICYFMMEEGLVICKVVNNTDTEVNVK